ncbi:acetolactate synthase small subunit [Elusimicrobiota bacterium]
MRHIISALVENKFGVLARISTLFAARGFNIDSLAVGETENPDVSRMTIVVKGDDRTIEQVEKQLNKLIDVIRVNDITKNPHIERDLALIKVSCDKNSRSEIMQIADIFRSKIIDVAEDAVIVEMTGDEEKVEAIIKMLEPFNIREVCRTGVIAMARGEK